MNLVVGIVRAPPPHRITTQYTAFPTLGGGVPITAQKTDNTKKPFNAAAAAAAPGVNGAAPKPAFSQAVVGSAAAPPPATGATPATTARDLDARFAEVTSAPYLDFGMDEANPSMWGTSLQNVQLLNACASRSIPQPQDGTWTQYPTRVTPPPVPIPPTYPTTKLPILETPALFAKVDPEVLFFAFYYQPGTYQQYLAAHQLKSQSWRYHKVHRAWLSVCCLLGVVSSCLLSVCIHDPFHNDTHSAMMTQASRCRTSLMGVVLVCILTTTLCMMTTQQGGATGLNQILCLIRTPWKTN